jgi:hypothetical protein
MGFGPNFTRVAIGPNAHGEPTLFIDGASDGVVEPRVEILWVEADKVQAAHHEAGASARLAAFEFRGLALADGAAQRSLADRDVTNSQWRVELTPPPEDFAAPDTWISLSGRMPTEDADGAPDYVVWSNMLKVERVGKPR